MDFIDLKTQYRRLREPINARIQAVLDHGQYIMGPEIAELEEKLAEFTGTRHCVAVSSGTDALLIALMAYGIGPGDEVVTSPFTFIATAEMIALVGAKPVFVDIDARTYNLDPALLEAAITPRTKAIMPVSLYGQCADFDAISAIASKHGIPVIEDAAQSLGATYKERPACSLGTVAATSFFPSKPLGCYGDGGALFTDDAGVAKLYRELRVHGEDRRYHHQRIGINGRMDSVQAAVLLAKLEVFPEEVEARARIGRRYTALLEEASDGVAPERRATAPHVEARNLSVFAQYTIVVPDRDRARTALAERGIPTAVHYPVPLHLQPAFAYLEQGPGSFPISEAAAGRVMSLPMHAYLNDAQQIEVVAALRAARVD
jgi:UDP-2-acetamido-2-deoxy-ribo-hexuluronate aminotransferase